MHDFQVTRPSHEAVYERFVSNFAGPERHHHQSLDALRLQIIIGRAQALRGGALTLGVPVFHPCAACHGSGWQGVYRCRHCAGAQMVEREEPGTTRMPCKPPGWSAGCDPDELTSIHYLEDGYI